MGQVYTELKHVTITDTIFGYLYVVVRRYAMVRSKDTGDKGRYGGFIHLCKIQNVSLWCVHACKTKQNCYWE